MDGNVLKKWELSKILTDASMNGGDRLSLSPDGQALLMDVDCGSDTSAKIGTVHNRRSRNSISPAKEQFVLQAGMISSGSPFWLSNDEFLCIIQKENENEPSIYRMPLNGKNAKLLVKRARTPSVSAP